MDGGSTRVEPGLSLQELEAQITSLAGQLNAAMEASRAPRSASTRWRGERMDYELGVWVLCEDPLKACEVEVYEG